MQHFVLGFSVGVSFCLLMCAWFNDKVRREWCAVVNRQQELIRKFIEHIDRIAKDESDDWWKDN